MNKGFGLTEMLIFIASSLVILVITVIVYEQNFGENRNTYDNTNVETKIIGEKNNNVEEIEEEKEEKEENTKKDKYDEILEKMSNVAGLYINDNYVGKTDAIVIKLSNLINLNYIDEIKDPKDDNIICNGYIIYDGIDKYDSYLRCEDNYISENYDTNFE